MAPAGSDPASAAFQAAANPSQLESHRVGKQGLEPRQFWPQTRRAYPYATSREVEMAGIEPAAATLAGRARSLAVTPHGQASAWPLRPAVIVLTLCTCQKSSLHERLAGTAGVEPAFFRFWGPAAYPLAHPQVNENRPEGFPWGGRLQVPPGAYTATTPPIWAASSCEIGFIYPARFGCCHVVIYPW